MKRFTRISAAISVCLVPVICPGQYNSGFYEEIRDQYRENNFVQLKSVSHIKIKVVNEKLEITKESSEAYIILKSTFGSSFAMSEYSSEFIELTDLQAYSYTYNGKRYRRREVKDFLEKINADDDSFYDDLKEYHIDFPSVLPGSILETRTVHKIRDPRLLGSEFLAFSNPLRQGEVMIECEPGVEMRFIHNNGSENIATCTESSTGKSKKYLFRVENSDPVLIEEHAPDVRYFVPHIIPVISSYSTPNGMVEVLQDTRSLYRWYYQFIRKLVESEPSETIKILADSITRGESSPEGKAESIYRWIQTNINYISIEYGLGGFIPRPPDLVLSRKYGDCKDNTSLMYSLMRAAGLPAFFTWVGTDDLPYTYDQVPAPISDNHMIVALDNGSGFLFLDGTSENYPSGFPAEFIQGKEALIVLNDSGFTVETVPVPSSSANLVTDTIRLEIEDNDLFGQGSMHLQGYPGINFNNGLNRSKGPDRKNFIESRVSKGNNKFVLKRYELRDSPGFGTPPEIVYAFDLRDYVNVLDDDLLLNLNLYQPLSTYYPRETRSQPIKLNHRQASRLVLCLSIPDHYKAENLPGPESYNTEKFSFLIEYRKTGNKIWYRQEFEINELFIGVEEFKEWKAFLNAMKSSHRKSIILSHAE